MAALVTDEHAITYNAAALSPETLSKYGLTWSSTSNIDAGIIVNEPLNAFQMNNFLGIPQAQGRIHYLYDGLISRLFPEFVNVNNHSIDKVISLLSHR